MAARFGSLAVLSIRLSVQKFDQLFVELFRMGYLAFPHHKATPAEPSQPLAVERIPLFVPAQFWSPVRGPRFWQASVDTTTMLVPKTSVHENNLPQARQDNVGVPWEVDSMKPKTITEAVQ